MASAEIDVSTPVHAYQEIHRKLLSLRKRKPTVDDNQGATWRSLKRRREFASPEVIKRLGDHDSIRKGGAGVIASLHVVESGKNMAVFFVSYLCKVREPASEVNFRVNVRCHFILKPQSHCPRCLIRFGFLWRLREQ